MSEQVPTNLVSLDELNMAIEAHTHAVNEYWTKHAGSSPHSAVRESIRADAWRAAFEWLNGIDIFDPSYAEGIRLVRERLK